ncbi:DnaJ family domain-containing protein [Geobacter sp.]|uniref:DnaJ family domain-containing protein n=1 Tax=Geobacter sp. TaxID=46610 RepID=UPI002614059C|nr:DnaJ family domain-containing protein [Geobacter sp.]
MFEVIAERKIREAMERGELDNLSLKGQPLVREDLTHVPEELRMGYKVLKNASVLPEELELRREIVTIEALLDVCRDEEERSCLKRRLTARRLRFDILMENRRRGPTFHRYEGAINRKLGF